MMIMQWPYCITIYIYFIKYFEDKQDIITKNIKEKYASTCPLQRIDLWPSLFVDEEGNQLTSRNHMANYGPPQPSAFKNFQHYYA